MTINPKILEICCGFDPIEEWSPRYTRLFYIKLTIVISFMEDDQTLYYLDVTTPEFLTEEKMPKFVKKLFIVDEYKKDLLIEFINKIVFENKFDSMKEFPDHVYNYFGWEFDDYYILPNE